MSLRIEHSISTWIALLLLGWLRSSKRAASWECTRCGSSIGALRVDGTSSSTLEIVCNQQKSSPCKLYVDLTYAGNLSISCGCLASGAHESPIRSGKTDGISSIRTSSSARSCGCDPGVKWTCREYPDCEYGRETIRDLPETPHRA